MMLKILVELRMAMVIGGANFSSMQSPVEFSDGKKQEVRRLLALCVEGPSG